MDILTKPPKSGHLRIADNFDQTRRCPLFRGLTALCLPVANKKQVQNKDTRSEIVEYCLEYRRKTYRKTFHF